MIFRQALPTRCGPPSTGRNIMTSLRDGYATLDPLHSDQRPAAMRTTPQSAVRPALHVCLVLGLLQPDPICSAELLSDPLYDPPARTCNIRPVSVQLVIRNRHLFWCPFGVKELLGSVE